jgi:hypothetical protein
MASSDPLPSRKRAIFDAAIRAREFEIDLFWKRSLFFAGFLATAFAGVIATHGKNPRMAVVVASFGAVCACTWTLANRGSKFWYESWEKKLQAAERPVTGPLFGQIDTPKSEGWWLSARRYSVSRLAVGLSDFTLIVWIVVLTHEVIGLWCECLSECLANTLATAFAAASIVYAGVLAAKSFRHSDAIASSVSQQAPRGHK